MTDKLRAEILGLLDKGYSVRYLFNKIGVSSGTYYRWHDEDSDFLEQCQRARQNALKEMKTSAEVCIASKIDKGESDSWKAGAWFLSHRHPAEYAERRIQDNKRDGKAPFDKLFDALVKLDKIETDTETVTGTETK
ncbi:MAG: hypothetical protein KAS32_17080 [Candidatus Peribacteraceae bacterium]|nr:hypothetical protein [Candidatus Peribacteraceae bacterium]